MTLRASAAILRATGSVIERLESRTLFASTLIGGSPATVDGASYTLKLNVPQQGAPTLWNINWGDDTSVQSVSGNTTSVTHVFHGVGTTKTITATAVGLAKPTDTSFGTDGTGRIVTNLGTADDYALDVGVVPDNDPAGQGGKIVVAGGPGFSLARYYADGRPDLTFGNQGVVSVGGTDACYGLAIQPDGKYLVGGGINFAMARFNPDGSPDESFGTHGVAISNFGTSYSSYDLALLPNGKIIQIGKNSTDVVVARFNSNGSVDTSFQNQGKKTTDFLNSTDRGYGLAVDGSGRFVVVGQALKTGSDYDWAIARYTPDGELDATFNGNGKVTTGFGALDETAWAVDVQADGKIVVGGRTKNATDYDFAVARYLDNGHLDDSSFGTGGQLTTNFGNGGDQVYAVKVLSDGRIVAVGRAQNTSTFAMDYGIAVYKADGSPDDSFGANGKFRTDFAHSSDYGEAVAVQGDEIVVAGASSTVGSNGSTDFSLARYHLVNHATVNVSVISDQPTVQLSVDGIPDSDKITVGRYVVLNVDHDEQNQSRTGEPLNDNDPTWDAASGQYINRINPLDNELRDATLRIIGQPGTQGRVTIRNNPNVLVWQVSANQAPVLLKNNLASSLVTIPANGILELPLKIEGINYSAKVRDTLVTAKFTSVTNVLASDGAALTISAVDDDLDSNNNDGFDTPPAGEQITEGRIEQDASQPGKYIGINNDDSNGDRIDDITQGYASGGSVAAVLNEAFTPLGIYLYKPFDLSKAIIHIGYAGDDPNLPTTDGFMRLWLKKGNAARDSRSAASGGDYLQPGDYSAAQLGLTDAGHRRTEVYIEGTQATNDDTDRTIFLYVDPDGASGPEPFTLFDETRVTVLDRTPVNLQAARSGASAELSWDIGPFGLTRGYRIYCGATEDFIPSAATLIGTLGSSDGLSLPAHTFTDPSAPTQACWYKVVAIDPAGTASKPATISFNYLSPGTPVPVTPIDDGWEQIEAMNVPQWTGPGEAPRWFFQSQIESGYEYRIRYLRGGYGLAGDYILQAIGTLVTNVQGQEQVLGAVQVLGGIGGIPGLEEKIYNDGGAYTDPVAGPQQSLGVYLNDFPYEDNNPLSPGVDWMLERRAIKGHVYGTPYIIDAYGSVSANDSRLIDLHASANADIFSENAGLKYHWTPIKWPEGASEPQVNGLTDYTDPHFYVNHAGGYTFRVDVTNPNTGKTASKLVFVNVRAVETRLRLDPDGLSIGAVQHQLFSTTVYDQFDNLIPQWSTLYNIQWTVSQPEAGTISSSVIGNTNYGDYLSGNAIGSFHIYAHATFPDGIAVDGQATVNVTQSTYPIESTGYSLSPVVNKPFLEPVASFVDHQPGTAISEYRAVISWGDGATSDSVADASVQVTRDAAGRLWVSGNHAYAVRTIESIPVIVQITHIPSGRFVSATSAAIIYPASFPSPTNVLAAGISSDQVEVSWDEINDNTIQGYVIWRTDETSGERRRAPSTPGDVLVPNRVGTRLFYYDSDELVSDRNYSYEIQYFSSYGTYSPISKALRVAHTFANPTSPITVTAEARSKTHVQVKWTQPLDRYGVLGWDILRADTEAGPYVTLLRPGELVGVREDEKLQFNGSQQVFDDETAAPNKTYFYKVVAVRNDVAHAGETGYILVRSAPSAPASASTEHAGELSIAPQNLAGGYAGLGRVTIHWDYPSLENLSGFNIYRKSASGPGDTAASNFSTSQMEPIYSGLAGDLRDYVDDGLDGINSSYYFYKVVAIGLDGDNNDIFSPESIAAGVDTRSDPAAPPNAPTNLVQVTGDPSTLTLSWSDNSLNEYGFDIYRRDIDLGEGWTKIAARTAVSTTVTANQNTFDDLDAVANTHYEYFVTAINTAVDANVVEAPLNGHSSGVCQAILTITASPPSPPRFLVQDPDPLRKTPTQITIDWKPPVDATNIVAYRVYRKLPADSGVSYVGSMLASAMDADGTFRYVDSGLRPGTYDYVVRAISTANVLSDRVSLLGASTADLPTNYLPTVQIAAPDNFSGNSFVGSSDNTLAIADKRITKKTNVTAIIDDYGTSLQSWTLTIRSLDDPNAGQQVLTSSGAKNKLLFGSASQNRAEAIFELDPRQFANGKYEIGLSYSYKDQTGALQTSSDLSNGSRTVSLFTETKLGNFTLPVTDLSMDIGGGRSLPVNRVYDSQRANELGDFGYGWKLDLADVALKTTARAATSGSGLSFRQGDLVYLTVPGEGQHVFQFWPIPAGYNATKKNPYGGTNPGGDYYVQFVCVDGSNTSMTVPGDVHSDPDQRIILQFNTSEGNDGNEFTALRPDDPFGNTSVYGPGQSGSYYEVKSASGVISHINAVSGKMVWSQDAHNNLVTYRADGSIEVGNRTLRITPDPLTNRIANIAVVDTVSGTVVGPSAQYSYDSADDGYGHPLVNLNAVVSTVSGAVTYAYDPKVDKRHLLTQVIDARGVPTLTAEYNDLYQLTSLLDADGNSADTSIGTKSSVSGSEVVKDLTPQHNETETIYDDHGNPIRIIKEVRHGDNVLAGYSVTTRAYGYDNRSVGDAGELFSVFDSDALSDGLPGISDQNSVGKDTQFKPFFVAVENASQRYTLTTSVVQSETTYFPTSDSPDSRRNMRMPESQTVTLSDHTQRVTDFDSYKLGKPQSVTTYLKVTDDHGVVTLSPKAVTTSVIDDAGTILSTTDASGITTHFEYTSKDTDIDGGLLLRSYRKDRQGNDVNLAVNTYYRTANSSANGVAIVGALIGRLRSSTDSNGRTTWYGYDSAGRAALVYRTTTWKDAAGNPYEGWTGTTTRFDVRGRVSATYRGAYLDGGVAGALDMGTDVAGDLAVSEPSYVALHRTSGTTYDSVGRVATSSDQFGIVTSNHYDLKGNLVETVSSNGTVVRSVYDAMGRVILATDPFVPNQADPIVGTRTVYDSLGRSVKTERLSGVTVHMYLDTRYADVYTVDAISNAGILPVMIGGVRTAWTTDVDFTPNVSRSTTTYRDQDGLVGTVADAERTTTYDYDLGGRQVLATVTATRPDGTTQSGTTKYKYDLVDSTSAAVGAFSYDSVEDANGHVTKTYKDILGRSIRTVLADGSFTETRYSNADHPIDGDPSIIVPLGGTETMSIAQRKIGDPVVATIRVYDKSGHLKHVYLPITDASPLAPHWQYEYDTAGNEISQADPNGHATFFTYDQDGNRLSRELPTDSDGIVNNDTEHWTYDEHGLMATHTDFNGAVTTYTYQPDTIAGSSGDPEVNPQAGLLDHVVTVAPAGVTGQPDERVSYQYDGLGRQSVVDEYIGSAHTRHTTTTYDPITGGVKEIDSPEGILKHAYDPATGRLSHTWTAKNSIYYEYDGFGRLWHVKVARLGSNSDLSTPQITTYLYDAVGNLLTTTQDQGTAITTDDIVETDTYTPLNQLDTLTTTRGGQNVLFQDFDYQNNGQKRTVLEKRYNLGGSLVTTTRASWTYDDDGRLKTETRDKNADGLQDASDYVDTFTYDPAGNRLSKTHAYLVSPVLVTGAGKVFSTVVNGGAAHRSRVNSVTITFAGNVSISAGAITLWQRDPDGGPSTQLTAFTVTGSGTSYTLNFSGLGVPDGVYDIVIASTGVTDGSGHHPETDQVVSFYRLYGDEEGPVYGVGTVDFNDFLVFQTAFGTHTGDAGYKAELDSDDNGAIDFNDFLNFQNNFNKSLSTNDPSVTTPYTVVSSYNDRDELTSTTTDGGAPVAVSYDADGNTLSDGSHAYTWDLRGRMHSVTSNGQTTVYGYDEGGVRVSKMGSDELVTRYLNDAENPTGYSKPIEEYLGDIYSEDADFTLSRSYVIGLTVLEQRTGSQIASIIRDGRGYARTLVVSGVVLQGLDYDAFGNELADKTPKTPFASSDGYFDAESGSYYQLARYRNDGRFLSQDGITIDPGNLENANLYAFAGSNPVSNADSSGHFLVPILLTASFQAQTTMLVVGGLIAATAVGLGVLHQVQFANAAAPVSASLNAPIEQTFERKSPDGFVYFLHGSSSTPWIGSSGISEDAFRDNADFGSGFYVFSNSPVAYEQASDRAAQAARRYGGEPIVLRFKMPVAIYNTLKRFQFGGTNMQYYGSVVNAYKNGTALPSQPNLGLYDMVEGPIAKQSPPQSGNWVPNPRFKEDQQAAKSIRAWGSMIPDAVLPAGLNP